MECTSAFLLFALLAATSASLLLLRFLAMRGPADRGESGCTPSEPLGECAPAAPDPLHARGRDADAVDPVVGRVEARLRRERILARSFAAEPIPERLFPCSDAGERDCVREAESRLRDDRVAAAEFVCRPSVRNLFAHGRAERNVPPPGAEAQGGSG